MKEIERLRREGRLQGEKEFNQLMLEEKMRFAEAEKNIERKKFDSLADMATQSWGLQKGAAVGALQDIVGVMSSESKKAFEIQKAAALATSVVNAYEAITGAYKTGANLGGPILGAAFAASAATAQFATISKIKAQSFGGGGGGGSGGAAGGGAAGAGGGGQTIQRTQQIQITGFNRDDLIPGGSIDGLIDQINDRQRDGKVILSRG